MTKTSEQTSIVVGFLFGALVLALFGWVVGPRKLLETFARLRIRPFSVGLLAVCGALFAQYRALLVLLDISPAIDSGLAFIRGVSLRQLVPVGNVAGPVVIIYSIRRTTGVSTDRGLPAAIMLQAVSFLSATLVGLIGAVLLLDHGLRLLPALVAVLTVTLVGWVGLLGALVSGFGIERTVHWGVSVLNRTVGRVSSVVGHKTNPENVSNHL